MIIEQRITLEKKLHILSDAAKYDVACTSSGVYRKGKTGSLGNSRLSGICHSFSADGRCISLLKVLLSNECVYDCKYCLNRNSNDRIRTSFTPEELCTITMEFYKRNYIEGLFLSSGVFKNPTYTMELMYQTLYLLRTKYHFRGYIHAKAVPGAAPELIEQVGYLADRMSVNLELPTAESLKKLAPNKTHESILKPIKQIQTEISNYRLSSGKSAFLERHYGTQLLSNNIFSEMSSISMSSLEQKNFSSLSLSKQKNPFVPAGQSTQMIIGATEENDYEIMKITQHMYQNFDMKRVFYSAYIPLNEDSALPSMDTAPPLLREHRLYQADWLLRYYGFRAEELLSPDKPNFNILLDPKCDWALRHLELFPVEIQTASYEELLKVPGIGNKSAWRIIQSRASSSLDFLALKKMGIVLKRAQYFITCKGKMLNSIPIEENFITRQLTSTEHSALWNVIHPDTYHQLSLFDDHFLPQQPILEDQQKTYTGQL